MNVEPANILFGVGVDKFKLGMGVSEVIGILSNDYPRLNFEINFPRLDKVLNQEVMISLLNWGIRLRFQPVSQRLFMIDYYDISKRRFCIKGSVFGGEASSVVTFEMLHKYLGPTLPGTVVENEFFLCNFGGASFLFAIPSEHLGGMKSHLPVTFSDGSSATLVRVFVYPHELDIATPKAYADVLSARITVVLKNGPSGATCIYIAPPSTGKGMTGSVELGMSLQDVISMLGDPAVAGINPQTHSYRYEYPQLGLEFYFSESTHILFQVILRNNLAHSSDFGRFERCPFRLYFTNPRDDAMNPFTPEALPLIASPGRARNMSDAAAVASTASIISTDESGEDAISPLVETHDSNNAHLHQSKKKKKGSKLPSGDDSKISADPSSSSNFDVIIGPSNENDYIDPLTPDGKIRELMGCWFGGCAVTREAAAQLPAPQGSPFAETLLYAYPEKKICFEVTATDPGFISSVTLLDLDILRGGCQP